MINKGISIIICCYNSAPRLPKTLECIAKQETDNTFPVELLIVDNASKDITKDVALAEWRKYRSNISFSLIDEETPGQMYARRKGVQEAKYEYILFCDDDNWLQADYVQRAFGIIEKDTKIGALGGQSIAVSDIDFPEWFFDFEINYAVGKQNVERWGYLWGAGIVIRKTLLNKVFDLKNPFLNQGRTGNVLTSGDDCEICKRILLLGYKLLYDESLVLSHYIAPGRLTWAYKKKLFEGFEPSNLILSKYNIIHIETQKSTFQKIKSIFYLFIKRLIIRHSDKTEERNLLYAKIALLFKKENISKDVDYRSIIKFFISG